MILGVWQFWGLSGLWAGAAWVGVNMAIAYGLTYLGGVLFGQDPKEAEDEPKGQSFSWDPHTTFKEGIARSECFGRNLHYGNVVARWTDVDAFGDEILHMILDYGQGPIKGVDVGQPLSDENLCVGGAPVFNVLHNENMAFWFSTAANINDEDQTTYVGFGGGSGGICRGRYEAIVTFDSTTVSRVVYRRWWWMKGLEKHVGYEKTYLWYGAAWHLIATKNMTTQGQSTDIIVIEEGGPWANVTKVKVECEIWVKKRVRGESGDNKASHLLYELAAWQLRDVDQATGSPVFINGQPAHNFKQVVIQGRTGTFNQTVMKGLEKNKLQSAPAAVAIYGEPARWTSPNDFSDDIEFTLAFLRGLYYYGDDGTLTTHSVDVLVEIRERDAESWDTVLETTITAGQLEPLYKAYSVNTLVPATVEYGKQYDLKLSKMSEDRPQGKYAEELQLRTVREVPVTEFTRPGRALLGITALATAALSGHIDVSWVSDDKLCVTYDVDGVPTIEFTRNRAWIDFAIRTQPVISGDGNGTPYEVESYDGLSPSRIDFAKWYEWATWCDGLVPSGIGEEEEARMPCDIICDHVTNVWSIAYEIAQIGRMYPYWQGVTLTGWIDKVTTESIDLITMDNTMARTWKSAWAGYGEMAGSVKVFYKDALQGYARKPRPVHNANAGVYTRIIKLEGVGVISESLATRVGNHTLKRNELIKNINNVRMGREAIRYKLGRVVRIALNRPNQGQSYRVITSPTDATVELDRVVEDVVENDLLWVKTAHATTKVIGLDSYTVDSVAGKVVTIKETWEAGRTPLRNHLAAIGIDGAIKERRIIRIQAAITNYFDVTLETYDTVLFNSDGVDPVLTNPDYVQPATEIAEPITRKEVLDLITTKVNTALLAAVTDKPQLTNCFWSGDTVDTVTWSKSNEDEPILLRWQGVVHEIAASDTALEYIYWDMDDPNVFNTNADPAVALAAGMYLVCTNKAGVASPTDMVQLNTISTSQVIDNAVTVPASVYTASHGEGAVATLNFTTTGKSLFINAAVIVRLGETTGNWHKFRYSIDVKRGGSTIYSSGTITQWVYPAGVIDIPWSVGVTDKPSADTYTYTIVFTAIEKWDYLLARCRSLFIVETKK